jgi:cell division protein FtsB
MWNKMRQFGLIHFPVIAIMAGMWIVVLMIVLGHIWMDHTTVAAYCNELQAEISRLKRLNLIKAQYIADEL